jgi:Glyoxalase-like domain
VSSRHHGLLDREELRAGHRASGRAVIALDHLVVAARSLDEGVRWVEARLGIAPDGGGRHTGFGTHNALLRLESDVYLEVLAPDPGQPDPPRPRLFGLDEAATRALLEGGPRLLHWVVRTRDLPAALAGMAGAAGIDADAIGVGVPMQRGDLRWTLALRLDGSRPPCELPSVIDWGSAPHPCSRLVDRGVVLQRLEIAAPAAVLAALDDLRRDPRMAFEERPLHRRAARLLCGSRPVTLE